MVAYASEDGKGGVKFVGGLRRVDRVFRCVLRVNVLIHW